MPPLTRSLTPTRCSRLLLGLLGLFLLRVAGQLIQLLGPVDWLPSLDAWQGSTLPYGVLLSAQLAILLIGAAIALRLGAGRLYPRRRTGLMLLVVGAAYFFIMATRLILGLTVLDQHPWFGRPIPAFFHLVLASYVLVLGAFHWLHGARGGAR